MDFAKLYTDFEDETALREDDECADGRVVVQYGFPGSGSTVVWQVLNEIFPGARKTHLCPPRRDAYRVVATVRDFRDVLCTYFTRADLPVSRDSIAFIASTLGRTALGDLYKVRETWHGGVILWLRYEDIVGRFDVLFRELEAFFGIEVAPEVRARCMAQFSLDANIERMKRAEALCDRTRAQGWLDPRWKQYTVHGINGLHITANGAVGKWRRAIPAGLHDHLNECLRGPLEMFGYLPVADLSQTGRR